MGARWTSGDDAELRRLWCEGVTRQRIADRMGRSDQSVRGRVRVLGLAKRQDNWSSEEVERATQMRESGALIREIAAALGRSEATTSVRLRDVDETRSERLILRVTPTQREAIEEAARREGRSLSDWLARAALRVAESDS